MGKVGTDFVVLFHVRTGSGAPRTGIAASITPRVRALDTAVDDGAVAAVVEIGAGRYSLIVRGAFTTAQGAGNYGWTAEVTAAPLDIGGATLRFTVNDEDDLALSADVATLLARLTALRAANLDEITAARLAELDPANLPADVDTLLARLTAGRASNLDEITPARLAELDPANMPADLDTLLARLTVARAANLDEITALRLAELDPANLPADIDAILLDTGTTIPTTLAALPAAIDVVLSAAHGAGAWDATATVPLQDIRDAMKLAPSAGAPAAGSIDLDLDTLLLRTVDLLPALAFLGATIGTPSVHAPATVTAGAFTWTVAVVGPVVTLTRVT